MPVAASLQLNKAFFAAPDDATLTDTTGSPVAGAAVPQLAPLCFCVFLVSASSLWRVTGLEAQ